MTVAQCLDYWFDNYVSTTLREKTGHFTDQRL